MNIAGVWQVMKMGLSSRQEDGVVQRLWLGVGTAEIRARTPAGCRVWGDSTLRNGKNVNCFGVLEYLGDPCKTLHLICSAVLILQDITWGTYSAA